MTGYRCQRRESVSLALVSRTPEVAGAETDASSPPKLSPLQLCAAETVANRPIGPSDRWPPTRTAESTSGRRMGSHGIAWDRDGWRLIAWDAIDATMQSHK